MNKVSLLTLLLALIHAPMSHAIVLGSDSAVSRNTFFTFPAVDTDNEMRGFCYMDGGFALQDSMTTCTFNSFFPVRQPIYLNNGFLSLATNMILENVPTFTSLGNIRSVDSSVHSLRLADNTVLLGDSSQRPVTFTNLELSLKNNVFCDATIHFAQTCRIVGNGNILELGDNANFIVDAGGQLELQNIIITGLQASNVRCGDNTASLLLTGMTWNQVDDFVFDTGAILFRDQVSFIGTTTFAYESAYTSTIETKSTWKLTDGIALRIGKHPISLAQPLAFEDSTSVINFDNCNFFITNQGVQFTKGIMKFARIVSFEFASTSTSNGVIFGTGNSSDDFFVEFSPAAVMNYNRGHFTYNNSIPNTFRSPTKTVRIRQTPEANMFAAQNFTLSNMTFILTSILVPATEVNTGKVLRFDDVGLIFPNFQFDITAQQYSSVSELLGGNHKISLAKGTFPLALVIANTGNALEGNGTVGGPITYLSSAAELTWSNLGLLNSSITFNSGTLFLGSDLVLKENGSLVGPGTIRLQDKSVKFSSITTTQSTNLIFTGNGVIELKADMQLDAMLTFSNECTIRGNGHTLFIENGGMIVNANSHLILQDIVLHGLRDTILSCTDDTGVITFNKVKIIMHDSSLFTRGALRWMNINKIEGPYTFAYQSAMTSTILDDSKLTLEPGVTFSFDPPISDGCNRLIEFIDDSSELILNGASLITTFSGIELTKGTLRVKRTSYMGSDSVIDFYQKHGISFGDGIDDINIVIAPEAQLYLTQGVLEYRNLSSFSLIMLNSLSAIRIAGAAGLQLFEDLDVRPGFVVFDDLARVYFLNGVKQIIGSINPQGKLYRKNFQL